VNYAALLGVVTAVAFAVPLAAAAVTALGLPRGTGFTATMLLAALFVAYWFVRARRALQPEQSELAPAADEESTPGQGTSR